MANTEPTIVFGELLVIARGKGTIANRKQAAGSRVRQFSIDIESARRDSAYPKQVKSQEVSLREQLTTAFGSPASSTDDARIFQHALDILVAGEVLQFLKAVGVTVSSGAFHGWLLERWKNEGRSEDEFLTGVDILVEDGELGIQEPGKYTLAK